jgi:hypothetical protein
MSVRGASPDLKSFREVAAREKDICRIKSFGFKMQPGIQPGRIQRLLTTRLNKWSENDLRILI